MGAIMYSYDPIVITRLLYYFCCLSALAAQCDSTYWTFVFHLYFCCFLSLQAIMYSSDGNLIVINRNATYSCVCQICSTAVARCSTVQQAHMCNPYTKLRGLFLVCQHVQLVIRDCNCLETSK